jgi:alpha-tubulin suppressor-like RCC1 family protein
MMRIPKPILRLIYDCCHEISTAETEASCVAAAVAAGNNTLNKSKNAAISLSNLQSSSLLSTSSSKQGDSLARDGGASSYVWSSGQNSYGELGVGDVLLRKSFSRVNALNDKNIVSIGAGNEHSLFVSRDGKLYTAGYNDNGQCGMGSLQQVRNPSLVTALEGEEIAQVHVYNGCEHTLAVTKDGKLFAFGYNYRGQVRCYFVDFYYVVLTGFF